MTEDEVYYVYKISNYIDGGTYIGITNDIKRRFREHKNNSSNRYLKNAIEVYGLDKFLFEVIETCTRDIVDTIEKTLISNLRDSGTLVYNVSNGGLIGNGSPGEEHWNHELTQQDVLNIRHTYASNLCTQRKLGTLYNIGYKQISKIIRGERWASVGGPITLIKQNISKVANQRKLTDLQVEEVRIETFEEYLYTSKVDIPLVAELYGISRQSMRLLLKGISYISIPGPILGIDYYEDFGA